MLKEWANLFDYYIVFDSSTDCRKSIGYLLNLVFERILQKAAYLA